MSATVRADSACRRDPRVKALSKVRMTVANAGGSLDQRAEALDGRFVMAVYSCIRLQPPIAGSDATGRTASRRRGLPPIS